MIGDAPEFSYYPDAATIDVWVDGLWQKVQVTGCSAEVLPEQGFRPQFQLPYMYGYSYVRFEPEGLDPFYGYWQPAPSQPAPLLVHTPGYGAEISVHPSLVMQGYNVLHINPLGYMTPDGPDAGKSVGGQWPVFTETALGHAKKGYGSWFLNCMQAIRWAETQSAVIPGRVSFFGTSQGGGATLLLGSIYRDHGVRCIAADEPWMINFPMYKQLKPDWWSMLPGEDSALVGASQVWRALGTIDALSHAHRLTLPVLLTAGSLDTTCPAATIETLFARLPRTRAYVNIHGRDHRYTQELIGLISAWFRMYA